MTFCYMRSSLLNIWLHWILFWEYNSWRASLAYYPHLSLGPAELSSSTCLTSSCAPHLQSLCLGLEHHQVFGTHFYLAFRLYSPLSKMQCCDSPESLFIPPYHSENKQSTRPSSGANPAGLSAYRVPGSQWAQWQHAAYRSPVCGAAPHLTLGHSSHLFFSWLTLICLL